jgi:sigma-B regulation protein RsbU (phosphoserine phosphatase)
VSAVNKIHTLWELVMKKGEINIYRRILRTALFGSLLTFLGIALLSVFSMFILQKKFGKSRASTF